MSRKTYLNVTLPAESGLRVAVPGDVGIHAALNDVRAFHEATDSPVADKPTWPAGDRVKFRLSLIDDERTELTEAVVARDMIEVADALADLIYVILGTALEFGIPLDRVWDEVQRSNMAKVDAATGKVVKREDGKVLKPEGWSPPDIARALTTP